MQPLFRLRFCSQNHSFHVSFCLFGVLSLRFFLFDFHLSELLVIRHIHYHLVIVFLGFIFSCLLKLNSSNSNTSSITSMCSECFFSILMAFDISDHTAGNFDRSGLRFLASISQFGKGMITSYLPSEKSAIIA